MPDSRGPSVPEPSKTRSGRLRLLDLFCCQGGAAMGYYRAGFDVVGVDCAPQPRYPFEFRQRDALDMLRTLLEGRRVVLYDLDDGGLLIPASVRHYSLGDFDAIHASPPCQSYLNLTRVNEALGRDPQHDDLIWSTRKALRATGLPYVIENVADARARLIDPVRVCGTGFGLPLRRHRLFESNVPLVGTECAHHLFTEPRYWTGWRPKGEHRLSTVVQVYGNAGGKEHWPAAMGIDWMDDRGMCEAIPPVYAEHIGAQLMAAVTAQEVAA